MVCILTRYFFNAGNFLTETKGIATLAEIHDLSKSDDFFKWLDLTVIENKIKNSVFYQNANSLLQTEERTQKSILKDFHSRITLLADPLIRNATSGNDFDLRLLRKQKISIYLNIPEVNKERLKSIVTLFWAQTIHLMTERQPNLKEEPYPVLAILDEFGNMAKINKLKEGVSFLRSYRIRPIVIVQYLSQITSIYGQHDAKGFLNSKVKIAFALNDVEDAKYFSECLGQKTVKVKSTSVSVGHHESTSKNTSFQAKALMTPDELMQMKSEDAIILLEAQPPIKAKKYYV